MKEKRYGLIWDGEEHEGSLAGTATEIMTEYMRGVGASLKIEHDTLEYWGDPTAKRHKGKLAYFFKGPNDSEADWEFIGYIKDMGSEAANLSAACNDWINANSHGALSYDYTILSYGCAIFPIETPEQEAAFTLPLNDLLDRITLLEYLRSDIDPDYEPDVRLWYYLNKGKKAKKAA